MELIWCWYCVSVNSIRMNLLGRIGVGMAFMWCWYCVGVNSIGMNILGTNRCWYGVGIVLH